MSPTNLPCHLIINEILIRTSAETVAASRVTCKELNEATQEWSFHNEFHNRNNTISGYFAQYSWDGKIDYFPIWSTKQLSLSFLPSDINIIEASSNRHGLILCRCYTATRPYANFILCKPTTKQWTQIPKPNFQRCHLLKTAMLVLNSNPNKLRYKIARFSDQKLVFVQGKSMPYSTFDGEVFDSATWAWRPLRGGTIKLGCNEWTEFYKPVITAGGFLYCLTSKGRVLEMDWEKETWEILELPEALRLSDPKLVECCGKLGMICLSVSENKSLVEVWLYQRNSMNWNLNKSVSIDMDVTCVLGMPCSDVVVFRQGSSLKFFRFGSCEESGVVKTINYVNADYDDLFLVDSDHNIVDFEVSKKIISSRARSAKSTF